MKPKIYVGCKGVEREVFRSESEPTEESHGDKYDATIGPFKTLRGANYLVKFGQNNPHIRCVADAERIAKEWAIKIS